MIYLSQTLFGWWLAAFALGVAASLLAPSHGDGARGGLAPALILLALGAAAAWSNILPGRAGLWLETAILALVAYGIGCVCGFAIGAPYVAAPPAAVTGAAAFRPAPAPEAETVPDSAPPQEAPPPSDARQEDAQEAADKLSPIEGVASRGQRPPAIDRPEDAWEADDLRLIRGVDPTLSDALHAIGVWRFSQIAAWSQDHVDWIAHRLGLKSPVSAKFWPPQARLLAAGAAGDEAAPREDDETALAAWVAALPSPAPGGGADSLYAGLRPPGFAEPPFGEKQDLTRIGGIDGETAARLNGLGVWSWRQMARWSPENARWIGAYLARPGVPERDDWVGQARRLLTGDVEPA
jgi:predicted flap endonuclease-1-like 5' DNA nuclease